MGHERQAMQQYSSTVAHELPYQVKFSLGLATGRLSRGDDKENDREKLVAVLPTHS